MFLVFLPDFMHLSFSLWALLFYTKFCFTHKKSWFYTKINGDTGFPRVGLLGKNSLLYWTKRQLFYLLQLFFIFPLLELSQPDFWLWCWTRFLPRAWWSGNTLICLYFVQAFWSPEIPVRKYPPMMSCSWAARECGYLLAGSEYCISNIPKWCLGRWGADGTNRLLW